MNFTSEHLVGREDFNRSIFEAGGVSLKGDSAQQKVRCPFPDHQDSTPSFSVNLRDGMFNCFGCSRDGDLVKFHAERNGYSETGAIADLKRRLGLTGNGSESRPEARRDRPATIPPQVDAAAFWGNLAAADTEAIAYLESRRLWPVPDGTVRFEPERHRIAVPLFDVSGRIVNCQRRNLTPKPEGGRDDRFEVLSGCPVKDAAFGEAAGEGPFWIVEGMADFLAAAILSERLAVTPLGAYNTSTAPGMATARARAFRGRRVYVSFDRDSAGQQALENTCKALEAAGATAIPAPYPAGFKDLAEIIEHCGPEDTAKIMQEVFAAADAERADRVLKAAEIVPDGWRKPSEVLDAIPHPKFKFPTGFPSIDVACRGGLPTGCVVVLVGWPDAGKTGLGTQIALDIATKNDVVVVLFTPDGGQEATAIRIGGLLELSQDLLEARDPDEKQRLAELLHEHRIFIVDDALDGMVFERVVADAERFRPDLPHVYLIDSAQECLATDDADDLDERHRVIALMRKAHSTVEANPIPSLAIVTSQVSGQAFTPARKSDRTAPIGAPAESKKISFLSHLMISLEGDPAKEPDFGRGAVVKSKLRGPKPSFGLRVDPATSRLSEIDAVTVEQAQEDRKSRGREDRVSKIADRIEAKLLEFGELSVGAIRERVTGAKDDIAAALDGLENQGRASWVKGGKTGRLMLWTASNGPKVGAL